MLDCTADNMVVAEYHCQNDTVLQLVTWMAMTWKYLGPSSLINPIGTFASIPFLMDLPPATPPLPFDPCVQGDWTPFTSQVQFELAEFLYQKVQMSAGKTDILMDILASLYEGQDPPFRSHDDLYTSIDAIPYGECPWQSFSVKYSGPLPMDPPSWMLANYDVWYHDPLSLLEQQFRNLEFAGVIDYAAKVCDLMSGQWAWDQSELIAQDPDTHRATFAPIVLGSDKTTGMFTTTSKAHSDCDRIADPAHKDDVNFRHFRRQLFHSSLAAVLRPVRDAMIKPRVTRCADGHFRHVIYGLGPYIANYPEQALLECIVQGWCTRCTAQNSDLDSGGGPWAHAHTHFPRADIHELIAPDLLHQLIKGTFKDHLVTWVQEYLEQNYPKQRALEIIAEIDHRLVPDAMVHAIMAFLDFCYIARKLVINERDLDAIDDAKGMLDGPSVPPGRREDITAVEGKDGDEDDDSQAVEGDKSDYNVRLARKPVQNIPCVSELVAAHYGYPELIECIRRYLYDQHNPNAGISGDWVDLCHCPSFEGNIRVFNCASATYFAPSDHSGCGGMHRNVIRCTPQWWGGSARYDCVFVDNGGSDDESLSGFKGVRTPVPWLSSSYHSMMTETP
ncbi:hypothetical protein HD554DRAFT_2041202 [Boletus coccyginus]|nr:hypothetical protein HD554DRAFT_2041202 [Boletus coccyginus]